MHALNMLFEYRLLPKYQTNTSLQEQLGSQTKKHHTN
jgi:hypothetical protein